jgi:hypothetical protein
LVPHINIGGIVNSSSTPNFISRKDNSRVKLSPTDEEEEGEEKWGNERGLKKRMRTMTNRGWPDA